MKALVFGSLNIDYVYQVPHFVQRGETLASTALARYCGGKGLNQAVALSRAGMETWMAGAIGAEGVFLLDTLREAGVNTELVARSEESTGHAIIQNSPDGDNSILIFGGANRSISREQAQQLFANGQVAFRYADPESGVPTLESPMNPNGSSFAIEGVISPDGLILGKMGHSERAGRTLYRNIPTPVGESIFENAVNYFRKQYGN